MTRVLLVVLVALFVLPLASCGQATDPADQGPSDWPTVKPKDTGTVKTDTEQPGTDEPDTDQPDTDQPDTDQPDAEPGIDQTAPDQADAIDPVVDVVQPGTDQPDAGVQPDVKVEPDVVVPPDVKPDSGAEPDSTKPKCIDEDGDGFGKFCVAGMDCDDSNPNFAKACPNCGGDNVPGCACKGIAAPCYSGDANWVGKGICKAGVQPCKDGFWGVCNGETMPENELCDNLDNDCDGQTDEGVKSSCGTCDMSCSQQGMGPQVGNAFELNSENSTGVGLDKNGYIVIDQQKISLNLKYIWVANSSENTVSKVDCKTGAEVGRYRVCGNPSRTSVDLEGSVWVGCRGNGSVAKIMAEEKQCVDKNGNGVIETSKDLNGDKKISVNEMVGNAEGQDECVKFIVHPPGAGMARAAGVDKENYAWIGDWITARLNRLHPDTGQTVETIQLKSSPYGIVIDQKGIIWTAGLGNDPLCRTDPVTKAHNCIAHPGSTYGINVDKFGKIWMGGGVGALRYDPLTGKFDSVPGVQYSSGIATSNDGFVYTANDGCGCITKIDAQTLTKIGEVGCGGQPHGIALDYDGFVWAVNLGGNSVGKIDPKAMQLVGVYPVGVGPYTYSDMTGYTLNYFTAPKGQYTATFFGGTSTNPIMVGSHKVKWQTIAVESDLPEKTSVQVRYRTGDDAKQLELAKWTEPLAFPPAVFPLDVSKSAAATGLMLQVELQLITSEKGFSPVVKSVTATAKVE
jgi:streptogramin lyase